VTNEIFGDQNDGRSLSDCFNYANGTFDPSYEGFKDRLSNFGNYTHRTFSIDSDNFYLDNTGGTKTFYITSNYEADSISIADGSFFTVSPSTGGGNFSFTVTVDANGTGMDRSELLYIYYNSNVIQTIYIYQYA
jgi:hypothetical protein